MFLLMIITNNPTMFAIPVVLLLLLLSFSSPSVTMAQQTPGATTTTPPLTPEEQEQQTRLQNVIAATNQNLDEAEKEVGGIVYTPRWSDVVWVEPDSVAVLIAYCLPGEFAESGQEILGGFELEVLESYEVALPQNFMAWMMVIGNEDRQDRLPAAVGVICASDTNDAETRVLSPQEQQQINNVIQQFTQVTNIDQVINIINNNVTTPAPPQNETGGMTPPANDTGGGGVTEPPTTEEPLRVEIIPSPAAEGVVPIDIEFNAKITGGTEPYTYSWDFVGPEAPCPEGDCDYLVTQPSFTLGIGEARTFNVILTVTDSEGQTASDSVQITVNERPPPPGGVVGEIPENPIVAPEALLAEEEEEEQPPAPPVEEEQPPPTDEGAAPPITEEEEAATTPPPVDDTGGG